MVATIIAILGRPALLEGDKRARHGGCELSRSAGKRFLDEEHVVANGLSSVQQLAAILYYRCTCRHRSSRGSQLLLDVLKNAQTRVWKNAVY